jgi:hypothetical protein
MKRDIRRLSLIALALFSATIAYTQDYLVTVQGDTIRGNIKPLNYGAERKVQVTEPGKKKTVYPFFKVKAYSLDGEIFQPVKGPEGYTFMKMVKSGYLSILAFQPENQTSYDGLWLLKRDGQGIEVPNITFEKGMKKFLEDCPALVKKIDGDVYNKKDLYQIVDEYNACMASPQPVEEKPVVSKPAVPEKTLTAWDALESKVKAQPDFPEKETALEMIGEIKGKISTSQKIPNFLIEGLKSSLNQEVFKAELDNALKEIN